MDLSHTSASQLRLPFTFSASAVTDSGTISRRTSSGSAPLGLDDFAAVVMSLMLEVEPSGSTRSHC
jgi:hypothetical protein